MEQNEIIEGNKLIAEFMGAKKNGASTIAKDGSITNGYSFEMPHYLLPIEVEYTDKECDHVHQTYKDLPFHLSWDWLMPVVGKIGGLSYNESNNIFQPSGQMFLENDIEAIWIGIVGFIKWYNHKRAK